MSGAFAWRSTGGLAATSILLVVFAVPFLQAEDDCNLALDAPSDAQPCKGENTAFCPTNCDGTAGRNGTAYSGNTVFSHVNTGSSKAAASKMVECTRPLMCTNDPAPDQVCAFVAIAAASSSGEGGGDENGYGTCIFEVGAECPRWKKSSGNLVKTPSAQIDSCDG